MNIATGLALIVSTALSPVTYSTTYSAQNSVANASTPIVASSTIVISKPTSVTGVSTRTVDPIKDTKSYIETQYADTPILLRIAGCESTFRQYDSAGNVLHGKVNHDDVGVMQINTSYHAEKATSMGYDLNTTQGNVAYAKYLYKTQGATPWSASEPCWSNPLAEK